VALPISPLSVVCDAIANFLSNGLDASNKNISVLIGAPSEVASTDETKHRVGLFFYRFAPSGFGPGPAADEPWLIRTYCLITVFGVLEDSILPGENELRLLGQVLRLLQEHSVLGPIEVVIEDPDPAPVQVQVQLQVVFQPLGSEDLNHIWATQGDTSYRPSVAYEMALVPVIPSSRAIAPPLVGAIGAESRAGADKRNEPFGGTVQSIPVAAEAVDTRLEGWTPLICFVRKGECLQAVALVVGSAELSDFDPPSVWVAGDPAAIVTLRWDTWTASSGWSEAGESQGVSPVTAAIDPEGAIPSGLPIMKLPFTDSKGQAVLYATRTYTRASDDAAVTVRSNPLLVTLYYDD
jgi:Pvc16 N-terminal domain